MEEGGFWLTRRDIVVWFDGYVLVDLHVVNVFQNCQTMSHARYAHLLQFIMLESDERLTLNAMLCQQLVSAHSKLSGYALPHQ